MIDRRSSLAYQSTEFGEEERIHLVLDDLLSHTLSRGDAVKRIFEVLKPELAALVSVSADEISRLVGERVSQYKEYWNPAKGVYEIDKGTKNEWIGTEDELYDDVRRSIAEELQP